MTTNRTNKFNRGAGRQTYTCGACGKLTRDTGMGEFSCTLCAYCYEEAGEENAFSDGNITREEFEANIAALRSKYNRPAPAKAETDQARLMREMGME